MRINVFFLAAALTGAATLTAQAEGRGGPAGGAFMSSYSTYDPGPTSPPPQTQPGGFALQGRTATEVETTAAAGQRPKARGKRPARR